MSGYLRLFALCAISLPLLSFVESKNEIIDVSENSLKKRIVECGILAYPQFHGPRVRYATVTFLITVDERGSVEDAKLLSGHQLLIESARQYLLSCKFRPYRKGQATKMRGKLRVRFDFIKRSG